MKVYCNVMKHTFLEVLYEDKGEDRKHDNNVTQNEDVY